MPINRRNCISLISRHFSKGSINRRKYVSPISRHVSEGGIRRRIPTILAQFDRAECHRREARREKCTRDKCTLPDDPTRPCRPKAGQGLVCIKPYKQSAVRSDLKLSNMLKRLGIGLHPTRDETANNITNVTTSNRLFERLEPTL